MIIQWLETFLVLVQILLGVFAGYLLFLTIACLIANRKTYHFIPPLTTKFLILVPAHNEEDSLPALLESLSQLDYPSSLVSTCVIADNCEDQTAKIALENGATVYIRKNPSLLGKGHALNWGLKQALESGKDFDAVVIVDADTILSSKVLKVMDSHLAQGERVIQTYYSVRNPEDSNTEGIRYAAFTVLHYLRPLARNWLGFSCGLKGNGMVFRKGILEKYPFSGSITEDIEIHMNLILAGERVSFAPDAVVWGEMPNTLKNSQTQHRRWESGRIEMVRRYFFPLLTALMKAARAGNYRRVFLLFDALMEHLIPPFAILVTLSLVCTFFSFLFYFTAPSRPSQSSFSLSLGLLTLLLEGFYLFVGLWTAQAPKKAYFSLLYAPFYIIWKVKQYINVLFSRERPGWIRTVRNRGKIWTR